MSHPCPHHCPKGGGGAAALLVLAVIVIAATGRAVVHAAEVVLEVVLITAASLLALTAAGVVAYAALRVHRRHARTRLDGSRHAPVTLRGSQAVSGPRRAIEAPALRLHVITSEQQRAGEDQR